MPITFRFETGCSNAVSSSIFDYIVKPCVLPAEFRHGRGKIATGIFPYNLPTYEFYNPSFAARQLGLGQLPPKLFFLDILKPREGIAESMEALRVFQVGSDLPFLSLEKWTVSTISSNLFNSWLQEWHSHLFCNDAHPYCIALDENFHSDDEVTFLSLDTFY